MVYGRSTRLERHLGRAPVRRSVARMTVPDGEERAVEEIFFGLRSNAAWFASEDACETLERRLKWAVMLYDRVALQDGRFIGRYGVENSYEWMQFPERASPLRPELKFIPAGGRFALEARPVDEDEPPMPVFEDRIEASVEADFYPLLRRAEIAGESYLRWVRGDLPKRYRDAVKLDAAKDANSPVVTSLVPSSPFFAPAVANALYVDSAFAAGLRLPMAVDHHVGPLIEWKAAQAAARWHDNGRSAFQFVWHRVGLPDFSEATWEEIHHARESAAGRDLRALIRRLEQRALADVADGGDGTDFREAVSAGFAAELVEEVLRRRLTPEKAMVNIGVNLIPVVSNAISAMQDAATLVAERRSWVALLGGVPRRIRQRWTRSS